MIDDDLVGIFFLPATVVFSQVDDELSDACTFRAMNRMMYGFEEIVAEGE